MKCIFLCLFHEKIDCLFVLLESIFIYGNLSDTQILIYTTSQYRDRIIESHLYHTSMVFEINDFNTENAHLELFDLFDLFDLPLAIPISNYETILYLDTNCVVKDDLSPVFDKVQKEKEKEKDKDKEVLYVLEESGIHYFIPHLGDKISFISDILLFRPCPFIQKVFAEMKALSNPDYMVCSTSTYKRFDHTLNQLAVSNHNNLYSDKIIHHGKSMAKFLNERKEATIQVHLQEAKLFILKHLVPILHNSGQVLDNNFMLDKQRNISNVVLNRHVQTVMVIGFHSGFSSLLMLLSNPRLKITCFDLGEPSYTRLCYEKIKEHFGNRIHLIFGDSTQTLEQVEDTFDLIHINGGHATEVAETHIYHSYRLSKPGTILIMDNYDFPHLHRLWDGYIQDYHLKPLDIQVQIQVQDIKYV